MERQSSAVTTASASTSTASATFTPTASTRPTSGRPIAVSQPHDRRCHRNKLYNTAGITAVLRYEMCGITALTGIADAIIPRE